MSKNTPHSTSRRMLALAAVAVQALAGAHAAQNQPPTQTTGNSKIPGLHLMPPGSVLKGISLPRYEKHRVTALFTAERMEVKSDTLLTFMSLLIHLYSETGETTDLSTDLAHYDFESSRVTAPGQARATSPRMEAQGSSLVYDAQKRIGLLKGPVSSAVRSDNADMAKPTTNQK